MNKLYVSKSADETIINAKEYFNVWAAYYTSDKERIISSVVGTYFNVLWFYTICSSVRLIICCASYLQNCTRPCHLIVFTYTFQHRLLT